MRVVSHRKLVEFYESEGHSDSKTALERWYDITENAEWHNFSDIKADFPTTIMLVISTMYLISEETDTA